MRWLCLAAILLASFAAAQGEARDAAQVARRAAADLTRAAQALGRAEGADGRIAALTGAVVAFVAGLGALRDGLRQIAGRERSLAGDHSARDAEIGRLSAALAAMDRDAGPLLLLHPSGPLGTARASMMLAEAVPALSQRAAALRADLSALRDLRALEDAAARAIEEGLGAVQEARVALSDAVAARAEPPAPSAGNERRAAVMAQVEALEVFVEAFEALPPEAASGLVLPLPRPVAGRLLRRAGEADAAGIARPGWVLATEPAALVSAPAAGTVRHSGPLLDYGNVIVLEPLPEHLLVLAGLSEVYVAAGSVVPEGAPLGRTGGSSADLADVLRETLTGGGASRSETIYIEVRRNGRPADPAEYFASEQEARRETR